MTVLDLFSGIGGFSLGLGAAGFQTLAFVEINPFCQKVLAKHWPDTPIYSDIREVSVPRHFATVLTGGFPCQDVSAAYEHGQDSLLGDRSGLWFEYHRLISEADPDWVIIENVENLRNKGLSIILRQLADLGYDAEWHIIPAYSVGLPHRRRRLWVVAHAKRLGLQRDAEGSVLRFPQGAWHQDSRAAQDLLSGWDISLTCPLRSYDGIPDYVDRVKALGNSIVPGIAYNLGMAIKGAR